MVKKNHFRLRFLALLLFPMVASSQVSVEEKNIFTRAESFYVFEEYELANQLYLLIETPENMNIKYKIGTCYLNIPSEKEKSIPYLEKAYMINNELEKGLSTLQTFSKFARETKGGMENLEYVEQQIQACKNAIQFKQVPATFKKETLGKDITMGSMNENPAVSYDGNSMVYTERRGISNAIMYVKKENGTWQTPVEITSELNAGEDCSSCSLNK